MGLPRNSQPARTIGHLACIDQEFDNMKPRQDVSPLTTGNGGGGSPPNA